ncbi:MAG: ATP-grasp domain-containing protein [candidate division NC10 bacterium]|nr:ATP-grasp domain-containing protein [candidate division NC10 bacterium]
MRADRRADVVVTDASGNHALAVVRSLGGRGLRVAAADSVWCAKAFFSRYCARRIVYPSPARSVREFRAALYGMLETLRPAVLMPMTERTIMALADERLQVEARVGALPLPSPDALRTAFDKGETVRLATSLGIPVPATVSLADPGELERVRPQLSYPAVIKPRMSERWVDGDAVVSTGPVEYCFRPEELPARYLAVHRRAPLPLIQEFIPGEGYGVSALCRHGCVRALFAHRRLRMIRPTGSGSALRESVTVPPRMMEATCRLLEALKWHGVAMVEFKLDRRDGVPRLMEINGRFWNSLPLAVAAGVDFPFLLYRLATEGDVPECFDYRAGVKCRWLVGDARQLVEVLRGKPAQWTDGFPSRREAVRQFMKFLGPDLHYDDPWLSDPLPFFADVADLLLRQVPRFVWRRRRLAVEGPSRVQLARGRTL